MLLEPNFCLAFVWWSLRADAKGAAIFTDSRPLFLVAVRSLSTVFAAKNSSIK